MPVVDGFEGVSNCYRLHAINPAYSSYKRYFMLNDHVSVVFRLQTLLRIEENTKSGKNNCKRDAATVLGSSCPSTHDDFYSTMLEQRLLERAMMCFSI